MNRSSKPNCGLPSLFQNIQHPFKGNPNKKQRPTKAICPDCGSYVPRSNGKAKPVRVGNRYFKRCHDCNARFQIKKMLDNRWHHSL